MTHPVLHRFAVILMLVGVGFAGMGSTPGLAGSIEHLSLEQFIDAQATRDFWYPPEPGLVAWTGRPPDYRRFGWIDYVGAADAWLGANGYPQVGTTVSGTFTRESVGDNLVEYAVIVHAHNALAWCVQAFDQNGNWDGQTMLFGAHVNEVAAGAAPALGDAVFRATWRQDADTPIADISLALNYCIDADCEVFPYRPAGWQLLYMDMHGTADGPLHAASGLGPDGTPGKMVIAQTGRFAESLGHGIGNADGYPAEVVDLHTVGK